MSTTSGTSSEFSNNFRNELQSELERDLEAAGATGLVTAEQLLTMSNPSANAGRFELIEGVVKAMASAGSEHGKIASRILTRLVVFVEENDLGETYAAETGFLIARDPDTVRAPDAAFLSHQSLAKVESDGGFLPLAPDLLVEVVSPGDFFSSVEAKTRQWLEAGTRVVIVADPANQTLRVYFPKQDSQTFGVGDRFSAGDVCGGWQVDVNDIFRIGT